MRTLQRVELAFLASIVDGWVWLLDVDGRWCARIRESSTEFASVVADVRKQGALSTRGPNAAMVSALERASSAQAERMSCSDVLDLACAECGEEVLVGDFSIAIQHALQAVSFASIQANAYDATDRRAAAVFDPARLATVPVDVGQLKGVPQGEAIDSSVVLRGRDWTMLVIPTGRAINRGGRRVLH